MNTRSRFPFARLALCGLVAAMIASAFYQDCEIKRLRRRVDVADRPKSRELSSRREEYEALLKSVTIQREDRQRRIEQIKSLSSQIAALQQELAKIRQERAQPVSKYAGSKNSKTSSASTTQDTDKALQNAGDKTPGAAVQTSLWAWAHHDFDVILSMNVFDPEDEEDLSTVYARLPERTRTLIHTPHEMAALLWGRLSPPPDSAPGLDILSETKVGSGTISVQFQWRSALAKGPMTLRVRSEGEEWKVIMPHSLVKEISATALGLPPTQWEILAAQK